MSMSKELQDLKARQRRELTHLHYTYLRTKRDIQRSISPDRFIRKHLGATLASAAIAGFFFAPRPGPRSQVVKQAVREATRSNSIFGHITQLIRNALGQLEHLIPAPKKSSDADPKARLKASGMGGVLQAILAVAASKLDLNRLIMDFYRHFRGQSDHHKHNGHTPAPPEVAVADVGTVKPDQFEQDFQ